MTIELPAAVDNTQHYKGENTMMARFNNNNNHPKSRSQGSWPAEPPKNRYSERRTKICYVNSDLFSNITIDLFVNTILFSPRESLRVAISSSFGPYNFNEIRRK